MPRPVVASCTDEIVDDQSPAARKATVLTHSEILPPSIQNKLATVFAKLTNNFSQKKFATNRLPKTTLKNTYEQQRAHEIQIT